MVAANAEAARQELIRDGAPASKVVTFYNGVDPSRVATSADLNRAGVLSSLGLPSDSERRFVTIVANLRSPYKDHATFIRAARMVSDAVPEAAFVLAGEGPLIENMRLMARDLGIEQRTFFVGRCMRVAELLAVSEVCVLSSKGGEGFSNAIIEYMAAARPVVATDVGGAREAVVDGETGWIVRPGDHAALGARIIELLCDPERACEMGARGCDVVKQKFSCEAQLAQIESLYGQLLLKMDSVRGKKFGDPISHLETIK